MCTLDIIYESIMGHSVDAQHNADGAEYANAVSRYMDIFSDRTVSLPFSKLYITI